MDRDQTARSSGTGMPKLFRAIVAIVVLALAGYGVTKMGAHSRTLPEAAAAAPAAPEVTSAVRPAAAEGGTDRQASPRACAPERGITEECTYY